MPDSEQEFSSKIGSDIHRIEFRGMKYSIPTIAIIMMLVGILLPSVMYSFNLSEPTPSQLLIAISISLFSSVIFLWILDATDILRFRAEWVSKSIYGAAIVSVLSTSVAVYKDAFTERKYIYEGRWEISVMNPGAKEYLSHHSIVLSYSENADTYWGYSNYDIHKKGKEKESVWVNVLDFDPKKNLIRLRIILGDGNDLVIKSELKGSRGGKLFESSNPKETDIVRMSRTKI